MDLLKSFAQSLSLLLAASFIAGCEAKQENAGPTPSNTPPAKIEETKKTAKLTPDIITPTKSPFINEELQKRISEIRSTSPSQCGISP